MKIRITEIPTEGREIEFSASLESLNKRVNAGHDPTTPASASSPEYIFHGENTASLRLDLHGSSVAVAGNARAQFSAACSRCAEPLERIVEADIDIMLKPKDINNKKKNEDEFEDLGFGFYDGKEVDCADIVEEYLILQLPYAVTCEAASVEECAQAQAALKYYQPEDDSEGDERLAIFKTLKVNDNGKAN